MGHKQALKRAARRRNRRGEVKSANEVVPAPEVVLGSESNGASTVNGRHNGAVNGAHSSPSAAVETTAREKTTAPERKQASSENKNPQTSSPNGKLNGSSGGFRLRELFGGSKKEKAIRFLAVAESRDNLSVLLECMYTAHLLRKKHQGVHTSLLVHEANAELARQCGLFEDVVIAEGEQSFRSAVSTYKPDILYSPDPSLKQQLSLLFTGVKIKIGGTRLRLASRLLNFYDVNHETDRRKLKKRGLDLLPELLDMSMAFDLRSDHLGLPQGDFVWVSLFEDRGVQGVSGGWPAGHAGRLARLLESVKTEVVIPAPHPEDSRHPTLGKEIAYLRGKSPAPVILENCSPQDRLAGMLRAKVVIGPAGPEVLLASLIGKPVVVLHDMRSYRGHQDPAALTSFARAAKTKKGKSNAKAGSNTTHIMIKASQAVRGHIKPSVGECIDDCPACSFNSCMEYISPERVFEDLKKILLPF